MALATAGPPLSSPRPGLALPVCGISIRLLRSYDSRDKRQGDFGVGSNLALQTFRVAANRVLGSGWRDHVGVTIDTLQQPSVASPANF